MKDPELAIDYIFKQGKVYAEAKANRIYAEEYRKSLKAIIMKRYPKAAVNAQERDAYSDPEYIALLDGLRAAVEIEEAARWGLVAAHASIEVWRSREATNRAEGRATL